MSYELIVARITALVTAFRSKRRFTTLPLRYSSLPCSASPQSALRRHGFSFLPSGLPSFVLGESRCSPQSRLGARGDTLVEVTIALAILALVLTGAFVTANRAFNVGQSAKERSQVVGDAQRQAEALQSFRDSHTWSEFKTGNSSSGLPGINVRSATGGCVQPCFHMRTQVVNGFNQWVPVAGPGPEPGQTSIPGQEYVRIIVESIDASVPESYHFRIDYGVPQRGGGADLASTIRLQLTDLDRLRR